MSSIIKGTSLMGAAESLTIPTKSEGKFTERKELAACCRKTVMCRFFLAGTCERGNRCNFAHGENELQAPPDLRNTQLCPTVAAGKQCVNKQCKFAHDKTDLRKFPKPEQEDGALKRDVSDTSKVSHASTTVASGASTPLSFGDSQASSSMSPAEYATTCASADADLAANLAMALRAVTAVAASRSQQGEAPDKVVRKELASRCRKTMICKFFQQGNCERGAACNFAHGEEDLRQAPDLRLTQLCPSLAATGVCQDKDCRYAHKSAELRKFPGNGAEVLKLPQQGGPVFDRQTSDASTAFCEQPFSRQTTPFSRQITADIFSRQTSDMETAPLCSDAESIWGRVITPDINLNLPVGRLLVKNTFLTLEEEAPAGAARRVSSAPAEVRSFALKAPAPRVVDRTRRQVLTRAHAAVPERRGPLVPGRVTIE
eukprot:TRINITY_DN4445_c0_g2_i1.p1 TRINITY_DN4445_c0_g2~~TRINITY_DN4445_c0_g2_i1.p1  ORF type:complete len:429 (-),score=76.80 TRINITY_DN4445_c0_g2_i1:78-1364(-)